MPDPLVVFAPETTVRVHPPNHSGILAQEILRSAVANVFISANWLSIDTLHQAGLLPQPEVLAGNEKATPVL
jgi:hypothetical protein